MRDAHDPRCERSTSKRCRCDCGGRLHGDQASQIDLEAAAAPPPLPQQSNAWVHEWFGEATKDLPLVTP
jgi:hypothetical protein